MDDSDEECDEADVTRLNSNLNPLGSKAAGKQSAQQQLKKSTPTQKLKQPELITTSDEEVAATNRRQQRREKEMIEKQLKLIEARRHELMQQHRKGSIGVGINAITHQQWDQLINEYNIPIAGGGIKAKATAASGHVHLELSSDEHSEEAESEELEENESDAAGPYHIRKALILDADETVTDLNDENKENKSGSGLYPSLSGQKKKSTKATERLYPNLDDVKIPGSVGFADSLIKDYAMNYGKKHHTKTIIFNLFKFESHT